MSKPSKKKSRKSKKREKAVRKMRNVRRAKPSAMRADAGTKEVDISKIAAEIQSEAEIAELDGGAMPGFSMPIPEAYQAPIRELEREILAVTTLKGMKELASRYGVAGVSKYKKSETGTIADMVRRKLGAEIGQVIFSDRMGEISETDEEKELGALYGEMLKKRNEAMTSRRLVRSSDCLPIWVGLLDEVDPEALVSLRGKHDVFKLIGDDCRAEPEASKVWESEHVSKLVTDLFDILASKAEDDHYFGADERADGEWGFWPNYIADTGEVEDVDYDKTVEAMDRISENLNPPVLEQGNSAQ